MDRPPAHARRTCVARRARRRRPREASNRERRGPRYRDATAMARLLIGLAFAFGAAALYAAGIALQALEAREAPEEHALRMSLFLRLVSRPRWLAGTAVGLAGWALQALALTRAPLTLVQPAVAASLVFLLAIG